MSAIGAIGAVPVRRRLSPLTMVQHSLTLAGRNLLHLKANPGEIIGFAIVQPLLVVALLVYVFGGAISGDTRTYLQYAMPGLLVQSSVMSVLSTGIGINQDIANGVFDRLRSLPIARIAPLAGHMIGNMVRVAAGMIMLVAVGSAQGFELRAGPWSALSGLLLALLFGMGLAWLSMLTGLVAKSAATVQMLSSVLTFPLTFISNVFVNTDTMPGWLRVWADINPISHLATAMRALMTGGPIGDSVWWTLGWTAVLTLVFAPLAIQAYLRRV